MKSFFNTLCIYILLNTVVHAITSDEVVQLHPVTTVEMNSITTPQAGSLVYNTDVKTVFFYTGSLWKKLRSDGNETIINAGINIVVTGNGTSSTAYVIGI